MDSILIHSIPPTICCLWHKFQNNVAVGNILESCSSDCKAMIDTSNSRFLGPYIDVLRIHHLIGTTGYPTDTLPLYTVPCSNVTNLADVTLTINGKPFVMKPEGHWNQFYETIFHDL